MLGLLLLAFIILIAFIYGIYVYRGGGGTLFSRSSANYVLSSQRYTLAEMTQNPPQTLPNFPANYPGTVPSGTYEAGSGWVHWEGAVHTPNRFAIMSVTNLSAGRGQHIHITAEPSSQRAFPFYYRNQ